MEQQKVYLKTIKEVSDALAAGKEVHFDNYRQDTLKKDENGLILLENKYETKLCVGCFLGIEDKPYILEQKPLEVKLWHLYKTNNGNIIFIIGDKGKDKIDYYLLGLDIKEQDLAHFYEDGTFEGEDDGWDLVKELSDLSQYFV